MAEETSYSKLIKGFKPEFGNTKHLAILEQLNKLSKKEKAVKELLVSKTAIEKTLKEIAYIERQIAFLIKG
jgi:Ni,Fe-hydrogenase III large subunit